jgi:protease II
MKLPGRIAMFDLSPDGRQLLVVADGSGRRQPWLVPLDGADATLIEMNGIVLRCAWRPDGSRFVVKVDPDGRDDYQLIDVDPVSGEATPIATQPGTRNDIGWPSSTRSRPYSPDGRYLAYASNRRDRHCFDIVLRDLTTGQERTVLQAGDQVPEDRYFPEMFSWDSRQLLVTRLHQQTEQEIYAIDIASGQASLLTPRDGPAKHFAVAARPEGTYLCATRDGNFTGLGLLDDSGTTRWIDTPEHDIEFAVLSADGSRLAWAVNEDGYTTIRHCAVRDGEPRAIEHVTSLPPDAYAFQSGFYGHVLQFGTDARTHCSPWTAAATRSGPLTSTRTRRPGSALRTRNAARRSSGFSALTGPWSPPCCIGPTNRDRFRSSSTSTADRKSRRCRPRIRCTTSSWRAASPCWSPTSAARPATACATSG